VNDNTKVWAAVERLRAAGVPTTGVPTTTRATAGTHDTTENIARRAYLKLPPADKADVDSWRDLGNSWVDSLLNSGVLSKPRRAEADSVARALAERQTTENRREASEHEASHIILAQSFGLEIRSASVLPDGSGTCIYQTCPPFEEACIALAPSTWINTFCRSAFPRGARGCEKDVQKAKRAYLEGDMSIDDIHRYIHRTLKANSRTLLRIADQIERVGYYP